MTVEEKIKMLMEQEEFAFIKNIPHEQLWKLIFALNFILYDCDRIPVSERLSKPYELRESEDEECN